MVAVYNTPKKRSELHTAGVDMKKLSVVSKDYYAEQNVIGYYTT